MRWSRGSTGGEGGRRRHLQRTGSYVNSNGIYKYLESGVGQDSAIHVGTGCSLAWQGRQGTDAARVPASGPKVEEDHSYGAGASPAQRTGHGPGWGRALHSRWEDRYNTGGDAPRKCTQRTKRKSTMRTEIGWLQSRSSIMGSSCPGSALGAKRPWELAQAQAAALQDRCCCIP